jgi:DNA-binding NarL/FixJ family response regulator
MVAPRVGKAMVDQYRVSVVEDQPLYRQMLALLLSSVHGIRLGAVCAGAAAALAEIDAAATDVALLDLRLPDGDGLAVGRELRRRNPDIGLIILSASDSMQALLEVPQAESRGWSYLSKTSSLSASALVHAIRRTAKGHSVLDPELAQRRRARVEGALAPLSPRQREVLALVAQGLTNSAIAERLGLSTRSVDAHVNAIYAELGIHGEGGVNPRVAAVRVYLSETVPADA